MGLPTGADRAFEVGMDVRRLQMAVQLVDQDLDGREFEGTIIPSDPNYVKIDTMVAGIRAKISLPAHEVAVEEKRALAENFFDAETVL